MDENFAYWSASLQRAGKWFSSSLALGTDVVANITDRLSSYMPCLHDCARYHRPSYFNPHGWPITHRSQDRNLTLLCTPCSQIYSSRVASYVIHGPLACWSILVSDAILIPVALNPFRTLLQAMNDCLSAWNFLSHCLTLLSMCVVCSTREILISSFWGYPQMIFTYNILAL